MPDWVHNQMSLKHDNPRMMEIAISAWNKNRFLDTLIPMPIELTESKSQLDSSVDYQTSIRLFDWCVSHWGTKWDIDNEGQIIESDSTSIEVSFGSAWTPPLSAYATLSALGFHVEASYFSPEKQNVGWLSSGYGFCSQDIEEWSEKWLQRNILPKLIEDYNLIDLCEIFGDSTSDDDVKTVCSHVIAAKYKFEDDQIKRMNEPS